MNFITNTLKVNLMLNCCLLIHEDKNLFDFSDFPLDSKLFDPVNKKVIGKMKDEFKGKVINGFIGLKSKMYSLITKGKGVNKKIRPKEFVDVLFNKKVIRHEKNEKNSK